MTGAETASSIQQGKLKVTNAPESRKNISALLEKYRADKGKIVHVKHIVPDGGETKSTKYQTIVYRSNSETKSTRLHAKNKAPG